MARSLLRYNARVKIEAPSVGAGVVLPVDTLTVMPVPYTGEGGTVVEYVDGTRDFVAPTWGFEVALSWQNILRNVADYRAAVDYLIEHADAGVNLYLRQTNATGTPVFAATDYVEGVIPELSGDTLRMLIEGRFRKGSYSLSLKSKRQNFPTLPDWLNS